MIYDNNDRLWSSLKNVGLSSKAYNTKISNSMMKTIHEKLTDGKPVIIGATTSTGNYQHWVVIYGYNGSGTGSFEPSDFLINDPGTCGYSTLEEFLENGSKTDRTIVKRIVS